jgi:hypothetical protein
VHVIDRGASHPTIAMTEDGTIECVDKAGRHDSDLFETFGGQLQAFISFHPENWNAAYSGLFMFPLQPFLQFLQVLSVSVLSFCIFMLFEKAR